MAGLKALRIDAHGLIHLVEHTGNILLLLKGLIVACAHGVNLVHLVHKLHHLEQLWVASHHLLHLHHHLLLDLGLGVLIKLLVSAVLAFRSGVVDFYIVIVRVICIWSEVSNPRPALFRTISALMRSLPFDD